MPEATWGEAAEPPPIDWRMSAALENVPRGGGDLAEVTSLEGAVRAWCALDPDHRAAALLTPERAVRLNAGEPVDHFAGDAIGALADRLPSAGDTPPPVAGNDAGPADDGAA